MRNDFQILFLYFYIPLAFAFAMLKNSRFLKKSGNLKFISRGTSANSHGNELQAVEPTKRHW